MAATIAFFGFLGAMGALSGGLNAHKQQQEIKNQVCEYAQQLHDYNNSMALATQQLEQNYLNETQEVARITRQIANTQETMRDSHAQFKKMYTMWTIFGCIFIIVLAFILATKKFILGATTEPE